MPRKYNKKSKSKRPAKKAVGKRRAPRRAGKKTYNVNEYASCSVSMTLQTPTTPATDFIAGNLYQSRDVSLDQFARAVQIAKGYQHFRIKSIKYTFKTYADTYTAGGAGRPNLYWLIDKSGAVPTNVTLAQMKQMGCRPKAIDNRPTSITFRPSVLMDAENLGASTAAQYRISPWLTTSANPLSVVAWNPSTIDHLGLYWFVEQSAPSSSPSYGVDIEVQFEFKKPLIVGSGSTVHAQTAKVAVTNDSPDGIVGGYDGV